MSVILKEKFSKTLAEDSRGKSVRSINKNPLNPLKLVDKYKKYFVEKTFWLISKRKNRKDRRKSKNKKNRKIKIWSRRSRDKWDLLPII